MFCTRNVTRRPVANSFSHVEAFLEVHGFARLYTTTDDYGRDVVCMIKNHFVVNTYFSENGNAWVTFDETVKGKKVEWQISLDRLLDMLEEEHPVIMQLTQR